MNYENIIVENEDCVTTITLNRPSKLNALDAHILKEMVYAIDTAADDDQSKVLIITGAGDRGFCSGADLTSTAGGTDFNLPGLNREIRQIPFTLFGAVMKRLHEYTKPVITAINGVATGAGLSLACSGDIRIGAASSRYSAIFVSRGLVADSGATYLLPRIVGRQNALEMMWTGEILDAQKAADMNLISRIVPDEDLMTEVRALALKIAEGPSMAIEFMKQMVDEGLKTDNFLLSMAYEGWAQEKIYLTEDSKEGRLSFIEKRPAEFKGE